MRVVKFLLILLLTHVCLAREDLGTGGTQVVPFGQVGVLECNKPGKPPALSSLFLQREGESGHSNICSAFVVHRVKKGQASPTRTSVPVIAVATHCLYELKREGKKFRIKKRGSQPQVDFGGRFTDTSVVFADLKNFREESISRINRSTKKREEIWQVLGDVTFLAAPGLKIDGVPYTIQETPERYNANNLRKQYSYITVKGVVAGKGYCETTCTFETKYVDNLHVTNCPVIKGMSGGVCMDPSGRAIGVASTGDKGRGTCHLFAKRHIAVFDKLEEQAVLKDLRGSIFPEDVVDNPFADPDNPDVQRLLERIK